VILFEHVGIRASAFKHGLTRENIRHAVGHPAGSIIEIDDGPLLKYEFVGYDLAANEIEIVIEISDLDTPEVIHAMKRRPNFPSQRRYRIEEEDTNATTSHTDRRRVRRHVRPRSARGFGETKQDDGSV